MIPLPYVLVGGLLVAVATGVTGFTVGKDVAEGKAAKRELVLQGEVTKAQVQAGDIAEAVGRAVNDRVVNIRSTAQVIRDQVPVYVPREGECSAAPPGLVSVLNAAATGVPLGAAAGQLAGPAAAP